MKRPLRVTRQAERQIRQAADHHHEQWGESNDLLHRELARGFELITTYPNIGAPSRHPELAGVRRLHLSSIRYHLYYRVVPKEDNDDLVEVLAFWHSRREPGPKITVP